LNRRITNRRIWEAVRTLEAKYGAAASGFTVLPILSPILPHETKSWVLRMSGEGSPSRLQLAVDALFASGQAKQHGVNHETFSKAMVPVLDEVARARTGR
jgi:hypothetical protein